MKFKEKLDMLFGAFGSKFKEQFGFEIKETTFAKVVNYLHAPKDASSLAVTRILFVKIFFYFLGLAMLFDIPDERGGAHLNKRWGDPKMCHFPLFDFVPGVPMPYMSFVYTALWIGALGIMLGWKYHSLARLFAISYWYLFFIEKSYWNNHSYLFGLVGFLLTFTDANCYWSLDAIIEPEKASDTVPYWQYFILKFQFFILYFMAGVKKGTAEWLTGYSVPNLSAHWVFTPFTLFLTIEQTDYLIVHWFIFVFDLTVAFWMMWSRTRHVAMVFCALFHLMNSRLFTIGMFPWVCLATMPLFYPFNWPKLMIDFVKLRCMTSVVEISKIIYKTIPRRSPGLHENNTENNDDNTIFEKDSASLYENKEQNEEFCETSESEDLKFPEIDEVECFEIQKHKITFDKNVTSLQHIRKRENDTDNNTVITRRKKITTILIFIYMTMQGFLPFSHFITKGYNNWTDGLYGYSWDMMVHTWDVQSVTVKVVDNEKSNHFFIDPNVFIPNDRWNKHGDMVHQYAICLNNTLIKESEKSQKKNGMLSKNISIFLDVWCSMNGRFVQRMFDPRVDLLQVSWSTFEKIPFLMPLLDDATKWRPILSQIRRDVHSWDPFSNVVFFADFPDYVLEKYIPPELSNVTLTILEGEVAVEPEMINLYIQSFQLKTGQLSRLDSGMFHRILNIGKKPAFYMFTFYNKTEALIHAHNENNNREPKFKLPIITELKIRLSNMLLFGDILFKGYYQLFFRLSMFLV
ncbi:vitamin K-dependent gamma-carboxylase [Cydia fagiglandana]|uniref:vitamin K-dependent gamma-carboxylase n=1 Tax=Cydia fagiglandana TaxID=1458189 RepID=UPI002FEE648F